MSSGKTLKLGLHKWESDDYVLREEFNDNFASIDKHAEEVTSQLAQTPKLSIMLEKGWAFTKRDPYTAWVWNNVHYDKETDEVVLIYHSKKDHGGSGGDLLMRKLKNGVLSDYTTVASVLGYGSVTSGTGILSDGTYVMIVKKTSGGVNSTVGIFFYKSIDKGVTWTTNEILIDGTTITPRDINDCYETNTGRILTNCTLTDGKIYTLYSDDKGVTWNKTLMQNNSGKADPLEGKYMQLNNGTIIMIMRASMSAINGSGKVFGFAEPALFSKSTDNGSTWTPLVISKSILDMSSNNCAILKNENSIELFYCSRYKADGVNASVYHAIASHEDAENDNFSVPVKIADGHLPTTSGDFGYPGVTKDKNGYVHLFFYDHDDSDGGTNVKYIFGKSYDYNGLLREIDYEKEKTRLADVSKLYEAITKGSITTVDLLSNYYENGDEKTSLTGGWVAGYSTGTGTVTKNTDNMELTVSGSGGADSRRSYIPDKGIDVTNVDYILADIEIINITGTAGVAAASISVYNKKTPTNVTDGRVSTIFYSSIGRRTLKVDVSNLTGIVYPAIMASKASNDGGISASIVFKCFKVWTEKTTKLTDIINDLNMKTQELSTSIDVYDEGRERFWLTGGWVAGYSTGSGTSNKNSNNLQLTVSDNYGVESKRMYIPNNGIDVTNVNFICAIANISTITGSAGIAAAGINVFNKKTPMSSTDGRVAAAWASTVGINTIKCDVSTLTGVVYPAVIASKATEGTASIGVEYYKVWIE